MPENDLLDLKNIFQDILGKSKKITNSWGGKLYFIYLPSHFWILTGEKDQFHNFVLNTANNLDIPIIDIYDEVFSQHPDPLSLFPFRMYGHYNARGYRLIAKSINKKLHADGIIP